MVMVRSGRVSIRKLRKGISIEKGRIFDQDGSSMDPIDVEPLHSAPLALVPYGTSKEDVLVADAYEQKSPSPN